MSAPTDTRGNGPQAAADHLQQLAVDKLDFYLGAAHSMSPAVVAQLRAGVEGWLRDTSPRRPRPGHLRLVWSR
jgi:hypothetical protein